VRKAVHLKNPTAHFFGNFWSQAAFNGSNDCSKNIFKKKRSIANMKNKYRPLIAALLIGSALILPRTILAAEKDMMKDDKGMMEKGMKDDKGMMKEGNDAMTKEKMKAEKSGKTATSDDKMKMHEQKKKQASAGD
jgi:hypothetical protein